MGSVILLLKGHFEDKMKPVVTVLTATSVHPYLHPVTPAMEELGVHIQLLKSSIKSGSFHIKRSPKMVKILCSSF